MSAAYDRLAGGYYNMGARTSGNPGGLAGEGAVRVNLPLMLADMVAVVAEGAMSASAAQAAAAAAFAAPTSKGVSSSNFVLPAVGVAQVVVLDPDELTYAQGQTAVVSVTGNATRQFSGPILSWDPETRTLQVETQFSPHAGEGPFNAWTIALTAPVDETLSGRVSALEAANEAQRSQALFIAKEFI